MVRFVIALVIVAAFVLSALIAFRRNAPPQPSQDVIDRVKAREREIAAKERAAGADQ